jgi:hypothetical protein
MTIPAMLFLCAAVLVAAVLVSAPGVPAEVAVGVIAAVAVGTVISDLEITGSSWELPYN